MVFPKFQVKKTHHLVTETTNHPSEKIGPPPKSGDPVTRLFFSPSFCPQSFVNFGGLTTFVLPEKFSASCFVLRIDLSWVLLGGQVRLKASEVSDPRRWPSQVAKVPECFNNG